MQAIDIATLEASVEALIQQQVAAYEAELRESLGRKLASGRGGCRRKPRSSTRSSGRSAGTSNRRSPEELEALAERFFEAVESSPGETMTVLAGKVELEATALAHPVALLKKTGRVRTVGERSRTRYYPMTAASG